MGRNIMNTQLRIRWQSLLALIVASSICGFATFKSLSAEYTRPVAIADAAANPIKTAGADPEGQSFETRLTPIEKLTVGRRVRADSPIDNVDHSLGDEVVASEWQKLTLSAPKRDGSSSDVVLLRPKWWVNERQATIGNTVYISVPECGIDGNATVLNIESSPEIVDGPGRVITGTFKHTVSSAIELRIDGQADSIRCTGNHPFWSETQQDFVRADSLKPGEQLRTATGVSNVKSISPLPGETFVYNIEVHGTHVYRVSSDGVLVHNGGLTILDCFEVAADQAKRQAFAKGVANAIGDSESYISRHAIDMTRASLKSDFNSLGFQRNGRWFWRQLRKKKSELFGPANTQRIKDGLAPLVDEQWLKYHPNHAPFRGDKLIHHHIDQGRFASGLPNSLHEALYSLLHRRITD